MALYRKKLPIAYRVSIWKGETGCFPLQFADGYQARAI